MIKIKLTKKIRLYYQILMMFYCLFLLYIMFFGFDRSPYDYNIVRLKPLISTVEFVDRNFDWKNISINILGNIFMIIPFGFLGIIFPKLNQIKTLLINFLFGIIIVESLQYFSRLGVFDIDDIILNTIGVLINKRFLY